MSSEMTDQQMSALRMTKGCLGQLEQFRAARVTFTRM